MFFLEKKQLNDIGAVSPKQLKENLNFIFTVPIDLKGNKPTKQKCFPFRKNDQNSKEPSRSKISFNKAFSFNSSNSSSENISNNEIALSPEKKNNFNTKNEENQ